MDKVKFTPLYLQVKEAILERVFAGEWPPGNFLPNEFVLAEEYGVSQGTLRKALEELTHEKHLIRYQGKGTTVADFDKSNSIFPFYLIYDKTGNRIFPLTTTLPHEIITAPEHVEKKLKLEKDEEVIFTQRTRPLDETSNVIVLHEKIYIPKKHFDKKELESLEAMPDRLYSYYITGLGKRVSTATEDICAVLSDEIDSKHLSIAKNTPIIFVQRTSYTSDNEPVEFREYKINTSEFTYKSIIV